MSSTKNSDMQTVGSSEPDYTSSSYPSTSTLGRTRTFGSERTINSDDTFHNVPSLRTDTLSSLSGRNRGAHASNVVVDADGGEDKLLNDSLVSSFDNISSSGRTFTMGSERTKNEDHTLHGIPSVGENSFVSTSEINRLANLSMDDNGADDQIESENETEKKEELKPPPPKRKRLEKDEDPFTITHTEMTVSALKDIEIRGRLIRPIYMENLADMNEIIIPDLFHLKHAPKITIIVSQSDAQMNKAILVKGNHRLAIILNEEHASSEYDNYRVPVIMFEINDEDFNEAYTNCLDLKVCGTAQELSRVNLEEIPPVVLDIAMQTHGNEERRSIGKFSLNDKVVFVLSYLKKIVSDKQIELMRSHPHKRSEFWSTLVEKGLVVPAGKNKLPMIPLYILLMQPSTQKMCLKKLEDDDFPTTKRVFITAFSASLVNDLAAATLFSKYPEINEVALGESLQKLTNKAKVEVKAVDEVKTEGTEFVLHDQVEDIEDGSRCFFYRRLPKESIQKMIEKKLQIVIARPKGATMQEFHRWPEEHIDLGNLHEAAYGGVGTSFPCALLGPGVIADDSDVKVPKSFTKLMNLFQKRFSGEKDAKIHSVLGYYEVSG